MARAVDILDDAAKLFVPGSLSLLLIAVAVGLALLGLRGRVARIGRVWLALTGLSYLALSNPAVAALVERGLVRHYEPLRDAEAARGASALVIFGNGVFIVDGGERAYHAMQRHTLENVVEGARLARMLDPQYIVTSGGIASPSSQTRAEADVMREALSHVGVPPARVLTESQSRNTYEQVLNITRLLRERQIARFVVVTAAPHMPRVIGLFRKQGLSPVPSVPLSVYASRNADAPFFSFRALEDSEAASYEYLALVSYWLRGRIQ